MNIDDIVNLPDLPEIQKRFSRYVRSQGDGCWIWEGPTSKAKKYHPARGVFTTNKTKFLASRVAWVLDRGAIGSGRVLHRCDVPLCVRPEHLFIGTLKDNSVDMARKGRAGNVTLTTDQVRAIRCDARPVRAIASDYQVTHGCIYAVQHRLTWAWLTED